MKQGQNDDENDRVDRCLAREESDVDPVDDCPEPARAMSVEPLNTREIDGTVLQQEATGKNYRRPQNRYAKKAREVGPGRIGIRGIAGVGRLRHDY